MPRAVEEALEGPGHLHTIVVLEGGIQCLQHLIEPVRGLSDLVHHVLHLLPGRPLKARQEVQDGLLLFSLKGQLLLVEQDALSPLFVVGDPIVEDRDVGVLHRLDGYMCSRRGRERTGRLMVHSRQASCLGAPW